MDEFDPLDDKMMQQARERFLVSVGEMKQGIAQFVQPHAAVPGSGGAVTLALFELGIERQFRLSPRERDVRAVFDAALRRVLHRQENDAPPSG